MVWEEQRCSHLGAVSEVENTYPGDFCLSLCNFFVMVSVAQWPGVTDGSELDQPGLEAAVSDVL